MNKLSDRKEKAGAANPGQVQITENYSGNYTPKLAHGEREMTDGREVTVISVDFTGTGRGIDYVLSHFPDSVPNDNRCKEHLACCPAHDDDDPSLVIIEHSDGSVGLCCRAGCERGEILAASGLKPWNLLSPRRQKDSLHSLYRKKLAEWGLDKETAAEAGLELLNKEQTLAALGWCRGRGSIYIPYDSSTSTSTSKGRYRFLGYSGKGKYAQNFPGVAVYYPTLDQEWHARLTDVTVPIGITEGEGKALCAFAKQLPMCVLGLGGVNSIVSRADKRLGDFLDKDLMKLSWRRREVFLLFDYDGSGTGEPKPEVVRAEMLLTSYLMALGATVHTVRLGEAGEKKKVGLDDFLLSGGNLPQKMLEARGRTGSLNTDLDQLTTKAGDLYQALCNLNTRFAEFNGKVIKLETGELLTDHQFKVNQQHMTFPTLKANGLPGGKPLKLGDAWLSWKHRTTIKGITFDPACNSLITPAGMMNTWRGFATVPRRGDVTPYLEFLSLAFSEEESKQHWINYVSHLLQKPWIKQHTIYVARSPKEGTGKSFLLELPARIIGLNTTDNPFGSATIKGPDDLNSQWTEWLGSCLYAVFNEPAEHGQRVSNRIKALTTNETNTANNKYGLKFTTRNYVHLAMTTNSNQTHYISPEARREAVVQVEVRWTPSQWKAYCEWALAHLPEIMAWHLAIDLTGYDPKAPPPITAAKLEMVDACLSDVDRHVQEALAAGQELFLLQPEMSKLGWRATGRGSVVQSQLVNAFQRQGLTSLARGKPVTLPSGKKKQYRIWVKRDSVTTWQMSTGQERVVELRKWYPTEFV